VLWGVLALAVVSVEEVVELKAHAERPPVFDLDLREIFLGGSGPYAVNAQSR
jgi:hypothetical protein